MKRRKPELRPLHLLWLLVHIFQCRGQMVGEEPLKFELFSSTDELQKLVSKEADLRQRLTDYVDKLNRQIDELDKLIDRNLKVNLTDEMAAAYVSNPINTFAMIKRAVVQWPRAKQVIFNQSLDDEWQGIEQDLKTFPVGNDLQGAFNGVFLLHETYEMDLKKFSKGIIEIPGSGGKETVKGSVELTPGDLETLAKIAFNRGFYNRACEWGEAALWKANDDGVDAARLKQLKKFLGVLRKKHDEVLLSKKSPIGKGWRTFAIPFDPELRKKKKFKGLRQKDYGQEVKLFRSLDESDLWGNFNALCRGERLRPADVDANLTCQYLHYNDPYLRLAPFKLETMNTKGPFVAVFRDFMPESEIREYLVKSRGHLWRSQHAGKNGAKGQTSVKRTSSQAWLDEFDYMNGTVFSQAATRMSLRLKLATRLHTHTIKGAEPYQVANYGIGGVYNHHTDATGPESTYKQNEDGVTGDNFVNGDRIATAMVYLSDVAAGGATVFPNLGVTIWPKKGDLAFWYNIDRNLFLDYLTYHGGCPVLAGSKWITNKWIRSHSQWRSYRCAARRPQLMQRLPPLNNDHCEMTEFCDESDLFLGYKKGRPGWRDATMWEDLPHRL